MTPADRLVAIVTSLADARERRSLWRVLRLSLWPRDRRFFVLLGAHAQLCVDALRTLVKLLEDLSDPQGLVGQIEATEKRGDDLTQTVHALLRGSLFPPFSRSQLHELISRLDAVLDVTEDAAQSLHLYHVTQITPEAARLAELAVDSMLQLQHALEQLATLKEPQAIRLACAQVDTCEAQADHVMRAAMSKLFREEADTRQLIKLKAVYELLESLTDECKHVAAQLQSMVLAKKL